MIMMNLLRKCRYQVVLIVIVALTYVPTLSYDFVWDDFDFIVKSESQSYTFGEIISGNQAYFSTGVYRPLRNFVYVITFKFLPSDPVLYHLLAIGFHTLATVLIYRLYTKIIQTRLLAFGAAVLFGVHPIHVEAVAWITASFDLVGVILGIISFNLYLEYTRTRVSSDLYRSYLFCFLAFLSSEILLSLPLIILLHWLLKQKPRTVIMRKLLPAFGLLYLGYGMVRTYFLDSWSRMPFLLDSLYQQAFLIVLVLARYLRLLVLPLDLNINHYFLGRIPSLYYLDLGLKQSFMPISFSDWAVWAGCLLHIVCFIVAWRIRKTEPILTLGMGWIYLGLVPVAQLSPQPIIFSERYAYWASIGLGIVLLGFMKNQSLRSIRGIVLVGLIVTFGWISLLRLPVWKNSETLWQSVLVSQPMSPSALNGLGAYYSSISDHDQARNLFQKATTANSDITLYRENLAFSLWQLEERREALALYRSLATDSPANWKYQDAIGQLLVQMNDMETALNHYQSLRPHFYTHAPLSQRITQIEYLLMDSAITSPH